MQVQRPKVFFALFTGELLRVKRQWPSDSICYKRYYWLFRYKRCDDVMNTALNQIHQTGKEVSAWQKPRTTWTVWESGYWWSRLPRMVCRLSFLSMLSSTILNVSSFLFGYVWIGYCFDLHRLHLFQWAIKVDTIWIQVFQGGFIRDYLFYCA